MQIFEPPLEFTPARLQSFWLDQSGGSAQGKKGQVGEE